MHTADTDNTFIVYFLTCLSWADTKYTRELLNLYVTQIITATNEKTRTGKETVTTPTLALFHSIDSIETVILLLR